MIILLAALISFSTAAITAYVVFNYLTKKAFEDRLLSAPGPAETLGERGLKLFEKFKEKLFLKVLDIPTETSYFLLLFLLYIHSGLSVRSGMGRAYSSITQCEFKIGKYLKEIISKIDSGVHYSEAVKVLDKFPETAVMREAFSNIFQAQELGTPIEDSLKATMMEMEKLRVIKAEERASKLAVYISIPLVLGFLPCILLLAAYPPFSQLIKALGGAAR